MGLNYKKLLLDLYNAPNADALYGVILSYGLDSSEYWKPYGNNFNNAVFSCTLERLKNIFSVKNKG